MSGADDLAALARQAIDQQRNLMLQVALCMPADLRRLVEVWLDDAWQSGALWGSVTAEQHLRGSDGGAGA